MRSRVLLLTLALVAAACGKPGPVAAPSTSISAAPATTVTSTTTAAPSTTSTTAAATTLPPEGAPGETYREEWLVETNRGEITAQGEHAGDAHRWVEIYGSDPGSISREVISIGEQAWNRYPGEDWESIGQDGVVTDLLNGHPFEVVDVVRDFALVGPDIYEGRDVTTYSGDTAVVAIYSGIDPTLIVEASAEIAIFANDSFATYLLHYERDDGDWVRLTYRTYDFGMPIAIERPEVTPVAVTCRDPGKQLIDEVGAYRSRYDLLHRGAAFSSIEELRTLDPWAWQLTINFVGAAGPPIDTLWVNGGAQYWRTAGGEWQEDTDGEYQPLAYRPYIDDLWIPDLVAMFTPIREAEVAGRVVDVYELDIDDMRVFNQRLVRNTDTLDATFWIEPCSSPELLKLELTATGRGYAEGEFHIVYELFDLGTTAVIDIPPEALDG